MLNWITPFASPLVIGRLLPGPWSHDPSCQYPEVDHNCSGPGRTVPPASWIWMEFAFCFRLRFLSRWVFSRSGGARGSSQGRSLLTGIAAGLVGLAGRQPGSRASGGVDWFCPACCRLWSQSSITNCTRSAALPIKINCQKQSGQCLQLFCLLCNLKKVVSLENWLERKGFTY